MAFQLQQAQQQKNLHQQSSFGELGKPKRNRSLDRSNDKLVNLTSNLQIHRNPGLGGSHYGINKPSFQDMSGSTTHLNVQLGPLQMYPHYNCDCKLRFAEKDFSIFSFVSNHVSDAQCGELKLGFFLSDDYLEVEVVSARDLRMTSSGSPGESLMKHLKQIH